MGDAEFGADHVHDALAFVVDAEMRDVVDAAVFLEQPDHVPGIGILGAVHAAFAADGGHVMIGDGKILPRLAHLAAVLRQRAKGVEGTFMDKIAVDVQQRVAARFFDDDVAVPDLVEQCVELRH